MENAITEIRFLNIKQASEYLHLAKQTIYGFTSARTIPFIKRGKKLLFEKEALELWVLKGRQRTIDEIENE